MSNDRRKSPARAFDPWRTPPAEEYSRTTLLRSHYFDVDRVELHQPAFGDFTRVVERHNHGDTLAVLATDEEGLIPLIEQYRVPSHRWTLELPAGHAHPGETPEQGARRELREEAGLEAAEMRPLSRFINAPSYSDHQSTVFLAPSATGVMRDPQGPSEERSNLRFVTIQEAFDLVVGGTIVDAKSMIGILLAYERHLLESR